MPTFPDLSDLDAWREHSARNLAAQWEHIPHAMGLPCERWEDAWAADLGSPAPYPNSAALLRPLMEDAAPELVARLDAFYGSHPGGPWMLWSAWPTPDLSATGLRLMGEMPLMVRLPGPIPPAPPELHIVEAHDDVTLRAMDHVMIDGYPVHELRPEDRLTDVRALGGPMTAAAVASAPDLPAVLQASDDGQPVYTRLGFLVVTPYTIWYKSRSTSGG